MYLKSLTVKGFKSFANPTTFRFEPGVTAVVGPNGSGKSNVVDALAWVMGEQGSKTLRGGKMEDVIFAGTAKQGPLSRAHVELTIDNSDGALPIEYTEVQISRTLYRGGGSEYAINGESARLLDVQELLSDSGLGREMHDIVGQGQLDAVLQAGPEERRGFIEEAAGILKHRRRKEKTLRKLEAMQTNLTRLEDLAGELRRQLGPLGKQAETAKAAAEIQAEVRDAKARLLAAELVQLRASLARAEESESAGKSERLVVQEQLERATLRAEQVAQALVGAEVDEARSLVHALERELGRLQNLQALATQRIALLGEQESDALEIDRVSDDAIAEARAAADTAAARVRELEGELGTASDAVRETQSELQALDAALAEQTALVSRHELELAAKHSAVQVARSALAAREAEQERREAALQQVRERLGADEEALTLASEHADADSAADELVAVQREAEDALAARTAEHDSSRDALHRLERESESVQGRITALTLALERSAAPAGTRSVSDSIRVRSGYEAAISAALGTLADAVLSASADDAIAEVERARQEGLGRIEVVVADAAAPQAAAAPAGLERAADVVEAPAGVLSLLTNVWIAADLHAARGAIADAPGVTVVTQQGDVMTRALVRGGGDESQSRLALAAERERAEGELDALRERREAARAAVSEARELMESAQVAAKQALAALREHDAAASALAGERSRARAQRDATAAELQRAESALEQVRAAVGLAGDEVTAAEQALERFSSIPAPMVDEGSRGEVIERLEARRGQEVDRRVALEAARGALEAARDRASSLAREQEAQRRRIEEHERRQRERERSLASAESVVTALPPLIDVAQHAASAAREALAAREAERRAKSDELGALRTEESQLRERLQRVTESGQAAQMQVYEQRLHLSNLLERAAAELALDETLLVAEHAPEEDFDREEWQGRLAKADRRLAQLGRVNPLALEEFAALEQRHAYLQEQLTDLRQAREDLERIIRDLDEQMEAVFAAAFADTQAAFNEVFPVLFPGGTGSLSLTNPDDLLTTGVEVSVRPAGKKIERLSLLSGGERSLAAVAFLVGIFKARPSPFYIMDEVEAALDDANLGRLLGVFEELRRDSQLIVITHQKRTMEIADALYGVSMREDGISQVVGQRIARDDAAAPAG